MDIYDIFEINMSRNKFIKYLHKRSDIDYSILRSKCKEHNWNMSRIYVDIFLVGIFEVDDDE